MRKYFHSGIGRDIIFIKASELATSGSEVLATLLGSCVSVILWDSKRQAVAMNHFVNAQLLNKQTQYYEKYRYGDASTEELIRTMQKEGSQIKDLRAKVVGGANMIDRSLLSSESVIRENIAIATKVLADYKIPITGNNLGGEKARWIFAFPKSGRTLVWLDNLTQGGEYQEV